MYMVILDLPGVLALISTGGIFAPGLYGQINSFKLFISLPIVTIIGELLFYIHESFFRKYVKIRLTSRSAY